ncbi:MAG: hypothetical protein PHE17_17655 [Thiothrix sp.]|uniref:hypothetical protein n=1 Tax=Thiothrix sp. TaxID=1032 RepID=UPI00261346B4|nr:hypothetical protein [Thiothrix sp.]MDD5394847.1 hypothetical protein [Thiothrix sp.]
MTGEYNVGQIIEVDGGRSIIVEVSHFFYDAIPLDTVFWSGASQEKALSQGWAIVEVGGKLEIQRYDESKRFDSDEAARHFVENAGEEICRRAIAFVLLRNAERANAAGDV